MKKTKSVKVAKTVEFAVSSTVPKRKETGASPTYNESASLHAISLGSPLNKPRMGHFKSEIISRPDSS